MKALFLLLLVFLACRPNYQFTKGQILLPDYVCQDTLIVVESFNFPDSVSTDGEIAEFLKDKTVIK